MNLKNQIKWIKTLRNNQKKQKKQKKKKKNYNLLINKNKKE